MTPKDDCPLQEELICMIAGALEASVLQTNTLELRGPDREVRRVVDGAFDTGVDTLRPIEEEAEIKAAGEPRLDITVETKGITEPERERFFTICAIFRKTANRSILVVIEKFRAPDEAAVRSLAERGIAIGQVDSGEMADVVFVQLHFGGVGIGRA